jgi:putrescine aminotransferase
MTLQGDDCKDRIFHLFSRHVSSGKAEFFKSVGLDFVFGKRQGPYVWDVTGDKKLINCHCNGGVFNLGHSNPRIVQVLKDSLDTLDIGNHHLVSEPRAILAQRLAELAPDGLTCTVFGAGGGEAVDLAIKLARGYTGRRKIISASGGYHGHTGLALATGDAKYRDPFGSNLPDFAQVTFNDIASLEAEVDGDTAAVIFETIPATLGMPVPAPDFYGQAREICTRAGTLMIMDEIQTGLGRTGLLWGMEHFGVTPDIMVIGKGLSGGIYPMSATCFTGELEGFFHDRPFIHVSTFGGAEVGCPVALAVLEESSRPEFLEHVRFLSGIFARGFERLKDKHPEILVGLRQLGLMMGIEMVNEHCGPFMSRAFYDNGVLSVYANNDTRVSQLLPPLIIGEDLALEILDRVDKSLDDTKKFLGLAS